jgi:hypothetical protein
MKPVARPNDIWRKRDPEEVELPEPVAVVGTAASPAKVDAAVAKAVAAVLTPQVDRPEQQDDDDDEDIELMLLM